MPRIRDQYTDIAVYIYASLADARNGESFGGSGFLVFVPHETNKDHFSLYAVTNAHVVRKAKTPVIRLNRKDGTTECIPTSEEQWTVHQYGDDVAVFPLRIDTEQIQLQDAPTHRFRDSRIDRRRGYWDRRRDRDGR